MGMNIIYEIKDGDCGYGLYITGTTEGCKYNITSKGVDGYFGEVAVVDFVFKPSYNVNGEKINLVAMENKYIEGQNNSDFIEMTRNYNMAKPDNVDESTLLCYDLRNIDKLEHLHRIWVNIYTGENDLNINRYVNLSAQFVGSGDVYIYATNVMGLAGVFNTYKTEHVYYDPGFENSSFRDTYISDETIIDLSKVPIEEIEKLKSENRFYINNPSRVILPVTGNNLSVAERDILQENIDNEIINKNEQILKLLPYSDPNNHYSINYRHENNETILMIQINAPKNNTDYIIDEALIWLNNQGYNFRFGKIEGSDINGNEVLVGFN